MIIIKKALMLEDAVFDILSANENNYAIIEYRNYILYKINYQEDLKF